MAADIFGRLSPILESEDECMQEQSRNNLRIVLKYELVFTFEMAPWIDVTEMRRDAQREDVDVSEVGVQTRPTHGPLIDKYLQTNEIRSKDICLQIDSRQPTVAEYHEPAETRILQCLSTILYSKELLKFFLPTNADVGKLGEFNRKNLAPIEIGIEIKLANTQARIINLYCSPETSHYVVLIDRQETRAVVVEVWSMQNLLFPAIVETKLKVHKNTVPFAALHPNFINIHAQVGPVDIFLRKMADDILSNSATGGAAGGRADGPCATMSNSCNSLLYHMEQKYLSDQYVDESYIDIFGTSPCQVAIECGLGLLVLDRCDITEVGDVGRVSAFVKNVTELDLSWNQISSWSTVSTLLSAMPALKRLNLSHNPIEPTEPLVASYDCVYSPPGHKRRNSTGEMDESSRDSCCLSASPSSSSCRDVLLRDEDVPEVVKTTSLLPPAPSCIPICQRLTTLVLNGVQLPLRTIRRFVSAAPSLRELYLAENPINDAELNSLVAGCDKSGAFSTSVELLDLSCCGIRDWNVVLRFLRLFPNTLYLFVVENQISRIHFDDASSHYSMESSSLLIRSLTLNDNEIDSWSSIENLAKLRWLRELRIRNIPLFADYEDDARRHLIVGRLRSLDWLNGSNITPNQREEAERFFIRFYQNSPDRPHIYNQLVAQHGNVEQLVKVDLTPRRFARIVLRCDETNYNAQVSICLAWTMLTLMKHIEKVTGIPISRLRIFHSAGGMSRPVELRLPGQRLKCLHIEDGDEFFILSKIQLSKKSSTKRCDPC